MTCVRCQKANPDVLINGMCLTCVNEDAFRARDKEIARLKADLVRAAEDRDEARDCGQAVVCAKPPGCQRHWEERNRELVHDRDEALTAAQAAQVERDRLRGERDDLRAARANAEHERDVAVSAWRSLLDECEAAKTERVRRGLGGQSVGPSEWSMVPLSMVHRLAREARQIIDGSQYRYLYDLLHEAHAGIDAAEKESVRLRAVRTAAREVLRVFRVEGPDAETVVYAPDPCGAAPVLYALLRAVEGADVRPMVAPATPTGPDADGKVTT